MKTRLKQLSWLRLADSVLLVILLVNPAFPVLAYGASHPDSAQRVVIASAVLVPARISELGFLISGIAREVPVKEGDSVTTGQTLIVLDTPDLEFAVTEAQAALRAAQAEATVQSYRRVEVQRNGKTFYVAAPAEARQRLDAEIQRAQVALEIAQINRAENTLTAPFDGVIASITVIPGEFVESDQAILTLATLNELQIETTDLSERDITRVKMGAPVKITIEALNESFDGKVIAVSPIADTVGGDVTFKVTIAFDEQPKNLLWGMTAEVNIGE
jgi:RND family efflux transporter MFP subunit